VGDKWVDLQTFWMTVIELLIINCHDRITSILYVPSRCRELLFCKRFCVSTRLL